MGIRLATKCLFELHPQSIQFCSNGSLTNLNIQHIGVDVSTLCLFALSKGKAHFILLRSIQRILKFINPKRPLENLYIAFDGRAPKSKPKFDWAIKNRLHLDLPNKVKPLVELYLARYFYNIHISLPNEIGEGEQKALQCLSKHENEISLMVSTDSDVIISCLLRDDMPNWILTKRPISHKKQSYVLLDISTLKKIYSKTSIKTFIAMSANSNMVAHKIKKLLTYLISDQNENFLQQFFKMNRLLRKSNPTQNWKLNLGKLFWTLDYYDGKIYPGLEEFDKTSFNE